MHTWVHASSAVLQSAMESDAEASHADALTSSTRQACFNMAVDFADLLLMLLHRTVELHTRRLCACLVHLLVTA
eukprot:m.1586077 g.1586077  ORF g.1586077 m.1586077 type:complete len:74 (+) comp25327_c0_seq9:336-557(+)